MTERIDSWNVISGGPSREYLKKSDLIPDSPVVSVNRAIDVIDRGIDVNFACFADPPSHLVKPLGLERFLVPPIQVWCPRPGLIPDGRINIFHDMVSLWEPFLPASVGIRTTPFGTLVDPRDGKKRYFFSLMGALERVAMFRPKKIRLLCADMSGSWIQGKDEQECEVLQSGLASAKRQVSGYNKQLKLTKDKAQRHAIEVARNQQSTIVQMMEKSGDHRHFQRWEYEKIQLEEFTRRAKTVNIEVEHWTPSVVLS